MYPFLLLINRCNLFQGPSDARFFWGEAAAPDGYTSVAAVQEAAGSGGRRRAAGLGARRPFGSFSLRSFQNGFL